MKDKLNIKVGDIVFGVDGKGELVSSIRHKYHGVRDDWDESCCINGYYWYYDDIIKVKSGK